MRRWVVATTVASLLVLLWAGQPAVASGCFGGHVGASYLKVLANAGVKSGEDFVSGVPDSGVSIVHPMQIASDTGSDFIGWGTYRGEGTNVSGALSNCPDHSMASWNVYIDGRKFGTYFCRVGYGSVSSTATDQLFTLRFGDCDGTSKWRAYLNGVRKTCQLINDDSAYASAVGGEVVYTIAQQTIDIRYHDLEFYDPVGDNWISWSAYSTSVCEDFGFRIRKLSPDDVWAEAYP